MFQEIFSEAIPGLSNASDSDIASGVRLVILSEKASIHANETLFLLFGSGSTSFEAMPSEYETDWLVENGLIETICNEAYVLTSEGLRVCEIIKAIKAINK